MLRLPHAGRRWAALAVASMLLLSSCASASRPGAGPPSPASAAPPAPAAGPSSLRELPAGDSLDGAVGRDFQQAGAEFGVPAELLVALAYAQTRLTAGHQPDGEPPHHGHVGPGEAIGIMGLSPDQLDRGAAAAGVSLSAAASNRLDNIRAAAALLADLAAAEENQAPHHWYAAVAAMSSQSGWQARSFADQIYNYVRRGVDHTLPGGEHLRLAPRTVDPDRGALAGAAAPMSEDYPAARWIPAHPDNYNGTYNREADGTEIEYIVIHVVQGSYNSAINWFRNPRSGVSTQYVIRASDGEVTQMVRDKHVGFHVGRTYNPPSIGIEHEGWVDDCSWFTDEMYRSSAALTRHLAARYGIPLDRQHIIGHVEIPGTTHTDPGPCWDWPYYMSLLQGQWSTVVDNETTGRFYADPDGWSSSSWNSLKHGSGYRYSLPRPYQQSAFYKFNLPEDGLYDVYAWYPSHPQYNGRVRVLIWHAAETGGFEQATPVYLDQRTGGGNWVYLATVPMTAGDRWRIQLSRQSSEPGYVIADAFMMVRH